MKTIFKTERKRNYTTLPNKLARDNTLSLEARGLLLLILSNSDEWVVHQTWIQDQCTNGRESIRTAMRQLERAGYSAFRERLDKGKFVAGVWTFYDEPLPDGERTNRSNRETDVKRREVAKLRRKQRRKPPSDGTPSDGIPSDGTPSDGVPSPKKEHWKKENRREESAAGAADSSFSGPPPFPRSDATTVVESIQSPDHSFAVPEKTKSKSRKGFTPAHEEIIDAAMRCHEATVGPAYRGQFADRAVMDHLLTLGTPAEIAARIELAFCRIGVEKAWHCNRNLNSMSSIAKNWYKIVGEIEAHPENDRHSMAIVLIQTRREWSRRLSDAQAVLHDAFGSADPSCPRVQEFLARPATARLIPEILICVLGGHTADIMAVHGTRAAMTWDDEVAPFAGMEELLPALGIEFKRELISQELIDHEMMNPSGVYGVEEPEPEEWQISPEEAEHEMLMHPNHN